MTLEFSAFGRFFTNGNWNSRKTRPSEAFFTVGFIRTCPPSREHSILTGNCPPYSSKIFSGDGFDISSGASEGSHSFSSESPREYIMRQRSPPPA